MLEDINARPGTLPGQLLADTREGLRVRARVRRRPRSALRPGPWAHVDAAIEAPLLDR
jgi:hypothetical protein